MNLHESAWNLHQSGMSRRPMLIYPAKKSEYLSRLIGATGHCSREVVKHRWPGAAWSSQEADDRLSCGRSTTGCTCPPGVMHLYIYIQGTRSLGKTFRADADDALWRHIGDVPGPPDDALWRHIPWRRIAPWRRITPWRRIVTTHSLTTHCPLTTHCVYIIAWRHIACWQARHDEQGRRRTVFFVCGKINRGM